VKVLFVYAHHEPKSLTAALLARGRAELEALGHEVRVSDLHAKGFDPVAKAGDFLDRRFPEHLQYDREQKHASAMQAYSEDIREEIDDLLWCDGLVLQFPLWWWSVPAILKGWLDRVLVNGIAYGKGMRLDTGGLKGRRAMLAMTTGCYPEMVAERGLLGALEVSLWHLHSGTLAYTGFEVLEPFVAWSAHYNDRAVLEDYLDAYAGRMRNFWTDTPMFFHPQADFGADWRLRPGIDPRAVGQQAKSTLIR
jgi:NAD(P)H dehydrogenase (quinone)